MNIFIIMLLILAGIIVLLFIIGLFSKKSYAVQRSITINKPRQDVFNYVKHLRNQDHFSKWVMTDPNMKKEYRGTDGTAGFVYVWEGNKKAGKGEQEIKKVIEGERLDVEVRFEKPFEGIAQTPFITESLSGQQTKLTWSMSSSMKYPMNIMLLFMNMDKLLGNDLQTSLVTLKNVLEKN